jgi:hypothetical protein
LNLTEDQIFALAPDDSSKKSGKELANPLKWVTKGVNELALWGECQGSGSKPYRTQVDIINLAFKCSCPSRKFPCKHGLGLLLFHSRSSKDFTESNMPDWVSEWISKRGEKQEKIAEKKDKQVDEAAQAKRQQARQQKVADGVEELLLWIKDIIRNGILNVPEKGAAYWDNMAKRMVDAQAPGLAGMVRSISNINFYKEGWQSEFLEQLLKMYLLICGYKHIEDLDVDQQNDIRTLIGFTQSQEELKAQDGVRDDWFILSKQVTQEDQLTTERNWLYGIHTRQYALILQFSVRGQIIETTFTPGTITDAELVFYKSSVPLRALVKQQYQTKRAWQIQGLKNWKEVSFQETKINALNPFINEQPFLLDQLRPVNYNNEWWLQDDEHKLMRLQKHYNNLWKLLSVSGGKYLPMVVIGKETEYAPVGVWFDNEYKQL